MTLASFERRWAEGVVKAILPVLARAASCPAAAGRTEDPADGGAALFPVAASSRFRGLTDSRLPAFLADFLGHGPAPALWLFRLLLWAFQFLPVVLIGRFRRFDRLNEEEKDRYVCAWAGHGSYLVAQGFSLLKIMAGLAWCGDPEFQRAIGMDGRNTQDAGRKAPGDTAGAAHSIEDAPSAKFRETALASPGSSGYSPSMDEADFVVVGTGAAGATFARTVAQMGASVVMLEEGPRVEVSDYVRGLWPSMKRMWRGQGRTSIMGESMIPYLQGCCVGGTTAINSGISWRIPDDVYPEWEKEHGVVLNREQIEACFDKIERDLRIEETPETIWGENNRLLRRAADALGLRSKPTARNVSGCEGLSLCGQGCPKGHKLSMDLTYVPDAVRNGARLYDRFRVERILIENGRAAGIEGVTAAENGQRDRAARHTVRARKGVVVAASAVQSPILLMRSGLSGPHLGRHFQAHPGIGLAGVFDRPVRMWEGATQGYECHHFRNERFKIETLSLPLELLMVRVPGAGKTLLSRMEAADHMALWGIQVRCRAQGTVRRSPIGPLVRYTPTPEDCAAFARAAYETTRLFFAAGARSVLTGIRGVREEIRSVEEAGVLMNRRFGPRDFQPAVTHMFGTCRMSPDPSRGVVGTNFESHAVKNLYVVDSSVFPTNLGVNPQEPIMGLAMMAAHSLLA